MAKIIPPTKESLDVAISWLRANEGDNGEAQKCQIVADWIELVERDDYIRRTAREMGVPVALARKRIAEIHARQNQANSNQ